MTTSLDDALLADGPDLDAPETRDRWQIDSDELACWAFRKLIAAANEQARIRHLAADRIAQVKAWEDDAVRAVQHDVDFFTSRLIDYRRTLEAADPSLPQTYKLPDGSLVRRKGRESTKVTESEAFIGWALDNAPETLDYKPRVSEMKDWTRKDIAGPGGAILTVLLSPDGEVVPGVEVVTGGDAYDVRPTAGAFE